MDRELADLEASEAREDQKIQQIINTTQLTPEEQEAAQIISTGDSLSDTQLKQLINSAENSQTIPVGEYETSIKIRVPNFITNPDKYDVVLLAAEGAMPNAIKAIKSRKLLYELTKKAFIAYAKTVKLGTGQYSIGSRGYSLASKGFNATRKAASSGFTATSSAASRGFNATRNMATSGLANASTGFSNMRNRFTTPTQPPQEQPKKSSWFGLFGGTEKHRRRKHSSRHSKRNKSKKHKK